MSERNLNRIIDSTIGLRKRHKQWLDIHKDKTGKSHSRLIRDLLDKEIKSQKRKADKGA